MEALNEGIMRLMNQTAKGNKASPVAAEKKIFSSKSKSNKSRNKYAGRNKNRNITTIVFIPVKPNNINAANKTTAAAEIIKFLLLKLNFDVFAKVIHLYIFIIIKRGFVTKVGLLKLPYGRSISVKCSCI